MASRFRNVSRKIFFILNCLLVVLFLLACLAAYLDPARWWMISLLALAFPFLLLLLIVFIFFWLFVKPRYALLSFLPLLVGIKSEGVFFAVHPPHEFNYEKDPAFLRVATWNVARFIEIKKNNNKGSQTRLKMLDLLRQQNADILCLQEFHTSTREDFYDNIGYIQKQLNYPYYYFSFDTDGDKLFYSSIIFSRLPIIDSGLVVYPRPSLPEVLLHADIKFNGDTIRIFTTHLQSVQFKKGDYERIDEIRNTQDSLLTNSKTIFSKLKKAITLRAIQTRAVKEELRKTNYPHIFCGDFNDVPNSYTYFNVRGDMQDAFLEKGFGIGRTFTSLSPTLRIDYVLCSREFSIEQFNRLVKNYSDHYMLVADLRIRHAN
jgi:endonuclease/exonuclease/phosphatase family metal-dependent hydrolase